MILVPIGVARTAYRNKGEAPRQGRFSRDLAVLEIDDEYAAGLKDVEMADYLIVLYWAHLADRETLQTVTPWGPEIRGVFACRSPARPNPINVCMVELIEREGNKLKVRGLDALDGSAVLDVKPYSSAVDSVPGAGIAWFEPKEGEREEEEREDGTAAGKV